MNEQLDGPDVTDDELLAHLRSAAAILDPVPDSVKTGALAAFDWRDLDLELERLTLEHLDEQDRAGVRSTAVGRFFTLGCDRLVIELEAFPAADGTFALQGLVLLAPVTKVEVRRPDGGEPMVADVEGGARFALVGIGAGPLKLVFHDDDGPRFASEWLTL